MHVFNVSCKSANLSTHRAVDVRLTWYNLFKLHVFIIQSCLTNATRAFSNGNRISLTSSYIFIFFCFAPSPQAHILSIWAVTSDEIQNFKNRFSFVSNSLTTGSLILENPFAAVV